MKKCTRCKVNKPLSEFAYKNKRQGRLQSICRKCQSKVRKEHYKKNKDKILRQVAKRKAEHRDWFFKYKEPLSCELCGEDEMYCLDFHHLYGKDAPVSQAAVLGWSKERTLEEISKCEVLCANCHRKRHAGLV